MGWIHPSLTPTDHLFDHAHCQSSYKLFYNQGWLTIWHYLFLAGPKHPTRWLTIWYYLFLAGLSSYDLFHQHQSG